MLTLCIGIGFIIAPILLPLLFVVDVVFCVIAGLKARDGIAYRYPFAIRLLK